MKQVEIATRYVGDDESSLRIEVSEHEFSISVNGREAFVVHDPQHSLVLGEIARDLPQIVEAVLPSS